MTYLYCTTSSDKYYKFGQGIIIVRKEVQKQRIQWIYEQAKNDISIDEILEQLKLAEVKCIYLIVIFVINFFHL